jgi:NAD(P)-dependent dehydrogenase (short-subunit alcohol dehydrogenase family)
VALVTGAARGQGRSHAVALAQAGAAVVACDAPDPMTTPGYPLGTWKDLETTSTLIAEQGGRCAAVVADVRSPDAMAAAVAEAESRFGRLDVAVANAGIVTTGPLTEVSDRQWEELVATNLTGTFNTLRAVVPAMRRAGFGRIVVTSSMGGRMGIPGLAAYNATKWGVIGLAKSLALELAREAITVNVICPTTVRTPMVQPDDGAEPTDDLVRRMTRNNPIPRPWLEAADVTRALMYLVEDPGVVTGEVMEIGLGSSARMI